MQVRSPELSTRFVFLTRLIAPGPNVRGEMQQRSTVLAAVSVILGAILALCVLAIYVPLNDGTIAGGLAIMLVGCVAAFFLNRANQVSLGGCAIIVAMNLGLIYFLAANSNQSSNTLIDHVRSLGPILVLPILIAAAVINAEAALFTGFACAFSLSASSIVVLGGKTPFGVLLASLAVPVGLIIMLSFLAWLFERNRQSLIAQLRTRNTDLERSNAQLAVTRTFETGLAGQINNLSNQVADTFLSQAQGAADQLSAVIEVTTTLEELDYTAEQITSASSQVASTAQEALGVAEKGGSTIRQSLDATHTLRQKVERIAQSMADLSTQAQQISGIIEIITDVADETNLLALNATIEAAGAREYGRRFSAVANEVQRLATRTRDAADEVRTIINDVQEAIKQAKIATQDGLTDAVELVQGAGEIEQTIEGVIAIIENTATLARQITFSIQQQKTASSQVVETMRQISEVSQAFAEGSLSLSTTIDRLSNVTDHLGHPANSTQPQSEPNIPSLNAIS